MPASVQTHACVFTAALLAVASGPTYGETYFTAKTGDDAADGRSATTAFATVSKGVSVLKPGDTLTILPGEYHESVVARVSGTPEAPITIRAQYPGSVLLRGDVDVTGFERVQGLSYTYSLDFKQRVEGVAERSTFLIYRYQPSIAEVERNNGSFYQDEEAGRLYVHTTDSQSPEQHALSVSVTRKHGFLLRGGGKRWLSEVVIDGLSVTGYQVRDYPAHGPGNNMWLGLCIEFAERITVRRCAAYLNSGGMWMQLCQDSVIEDCRSFGNRSYHYPLGKNILAWAVHNTTFRRNEVEGFTRDSMTSEDDIAFYGGHALIGPFARQQGNFVSPSGDDAAVGTSVNMAWRTLAHATREAQPGHTVYVMAGEYREPLVPARSGTSESPIQFLRRGRHSSRSYSTATPTKPHPWRRGPGRGLAAQCGPHAPHASLHLRRQAGRHAQVPLARGRSGASGPPNPSSNLRRATDGSRLDLRAPRSLCRHGHGGRDRAAPPLQHRHAQSSGRNLAHLGRHRRPHL